MKFYHDGDKKKLFESNDPNLYSMLKREGYVPEGGWAKLENKEETEVTE